MNKWLLWLKLETPSVLYIVNTAVALVVAFGLNLDPGEVGAITTIASALLGIAAALTVRPIAIGVITAAAMSAITATAAFGLHASSAQLGALGAAIPIVLALLLRQAVTPVAAVRQNTTASKLYGLAG